MFRSADFEKEEMRAKGRMTITVQYANTIIKATGIRVNFPWQTHTVERMKLPGLIMP